ncbi:helix-turn-helix domain-containing protein [Anaerorhabdus sp.]|uniref:helix-turn-helix domain-containing protein n=1 Tax=Anaerorhabdus sp. TaxID=1872524 RepID=UPI002FC9C944
MKQLGNFLTILRKERNLTQQEVADALNVSNKTVSKWERDQGYPELESIVDLANLYGISIDELLNAERLTPTTSTQDTFKELIELNKDKKNIITKAILIIGLLVFFAIYFATKLLELSLFIYLVFATMSFTYHLIHLNRIKKYNHNVEDTNINWLMYFIIISTFIIPSVVIKFLPTSPEFVEYFMNIVGLPYDSSMNAMNLDFNLFITLKDYINYLPMIGILGMLIYEFGSMMKNKYSGLKQKKSQLISSILITLVLVISSISCVSYINQPTTTKKFTPEEYDVYKKTFVKTYTGFQRLYPELYTPVDQGLSSKDFRTFDNHIQDRELCQTHCNIENFNDSTYSVTYRDTFEQTLSKITKSMHVMQIISLISIVILIFIKKQKK